MKRFWSAALTIATLLNINLSRSVSASLFDTTEVQQGRFIAIASPFGVDQRHYNLLLVEQISSARPCWREYGSNPIQVEPLLLNFDFTGVCERGIDGNYYSIRIGNEDFGGRYLLSIVPQGNDLVLIGSSLREPNAPPVEIGRTNGMAEGYLKINLNPGWRFTKRTYQGKVLSHIYFTGDLAAIGTPPSPANSISLPPTPSAPPEITLPSPERELIFTKPVEETPFQPINPAPSAQPLPPPGRTVPTF
jgi:Protein of unknown function (DUF3747)